MIKNFTEFLNEKIEITLLKDPHKLFDGIMNAAKKAKLIKKLDYTSSYRDVPDWSDNLDARKNNPYGEPYGRGRMMITKSGNYLEAEMVLPGKEDYDKEVEDSLKIVKFYVASNNPIDLKELEEIFPDEIEGYLKNTVFTMKRTVEKDSSKATSGNSMSRILGGSKLYYVTFRYDTAVNKATTLTLDDIMRTEAYKTLMKELPLELASTPIQKKKKTLVFAVPSEFVLDPDGKHVRSEDKYMHWGYALYDRGYIRRYPLWQGGKGRFSQDLATVAGSFNASSIEGWEEGLNQLRNMFKKKFSEMNRKEGVQIFQSEEERHAKRGLIQGKKFGL